MALSIKLPTARCSRRCPGAALHSRSFCSNALSIAAPRFHQQDYPDKIQLERNRFDPAWIAALAGPPPMPVTSTRPDGPSGQSPSRSVWSCKSSRTIIHRWSVVASQLTRRAATDSAVRRVLTSPGVLLFVGLAVVALVAERSLTGSVLSGSANFGGGVLVPSYSGAGSLWHEYLAGYHDTGIGSAASTPAYVAVLAVLSTLFGGKPWLVTDLLLLGCVPLAGMTAFLATRRLTSVLAARIWIAASYALLPVATGAVAAGRIGTVVAFVLLPLIGVLAGRVLTGNPRTASRAAWAAAPGGRLGR